MCRRVKSQRLSVHVCCVLDHASVGVYQLVPLSLDLGLNSWASTYVLPGLEFWEIIKDREKIIGAKHLNQILNKWKGFGA